MARSTKPEVPEELKGGKQIDLSLWTASQLRTYLTAEGIDFNPKAARSRLIITAQSYLDGLKDGNEPRTTILDEAKEIVFGDRQHDYGETASSFQRIAELWAPVLGCPVSAEQVALCLIQLKIARAVNQHSVDDEHEGLIKRDTIVDIAGYAQCLALVQANP